MSLASTALALGFTELLRVHGETVTHTPSGGGASSISAVFQEPYEVMGEYGQVSNSRPSVVFRNADATMSKDDTVVRAGTTYNVMEVESTVASNGSRRAFLSQNTT